MPTPILAAALLAAQTAATPMPMSDAAECAAAHALMLQAMSVAAPEAEQTKQAVNLGLAMWEYELSAAAPNADESTLRSAAQDAYQEVADDMPDGEGEAAANARGKYLVDTINACQQRIEARYQGQTHPVITILEQQAAAQGTAPR